MEPWATYHPQLSDLMLLLGFDVFPEDVAEHGALALVFLKLLRLPSVPILLELSGKGQTVGSGAEGQQGQRPNGTIPKIPKYSRIKNESPTVPELHFF